MSGEVKKKNIKVTSREKKKTICSGPMSDPFGACLQSLNSVTFLVFPLLSSDWTTGGASCRVSLSKA